jgi:hypothetical protein
MLSDSFHPICSAQSGDKENTVKSTSSKTYNIRLYWPACQKKKVRNNEYFKVDYGKLFIKKYEDRWHFLGRAVV